MKTWDKGKRFKVILLTVENSFSLQEENEYNNRNKLFNFLVTHFSLTRHFRPVFWCLIKHCFIAFIFAAIIL